LEANKDGEIDVLTSVLTIAECTHAEGNSEPKIRHHVATATTAEWSGSDLIATSWEGGEL
jgi:hypothetical protein